MLLLKVFLKLKNKKMSIFKFKKSNASIVSDIVAERFHKESSFKNLDDLEKKEVYDYASNKNIICKFIVEKGYDILKKSFFVSEYKDYKEEYLYFDNFDDYYKYIDGDIYNDSCYFGYKFSDDEIKRFKIKVEKLNFKSFQNDKISNYSLETLFRKYKHDNGAYKKYINQIEVDLDNLSNIKNQRKFNKLAKKFCLKTGIDVMFSLLSTKANFKEIKKYLIEFIYENFEFNEKGYFAIILNYYGEKQAQKYIDYILNNSFSYNAGYIYERLKKFLSFYTKKKYKKEIKKIFDDEKNLYVVEEKYILSKFDIINFNTYFLYFNDFAKYLNNDLSDCDLSQSFEKLDNYEKYKTNENTKLPQNIFKYKVVLDKFYKNDEFNVIYNVYSENDELISRKTRHFKFKYFFDYNDFLDGDLSNGNYLRCENFGNLKDVKELNLNNIKVVSRVEKELGLKTSDNIDFKYIEGFEESSKYELDTIKELECIHEKSIENNEYNKYIGYISDIHFDFKIKKLNNLNKNDIESYILKVADKLIDSAEDINLIAGDISYNVNIYKYFIEALKHYSNKKYFITLGNHELWLFKGKSFNDIVSYYKDLIGNQNVYLVQNNLFYFVEDEMFEITEQELNGITIEKLKEVTRKARLIIFGGIGFAGLNNEFNADNDIYQGAISREEEIKQSKIFSNLYNKIKEALDGKNVIIMTHMKLEDWSNDKHNDGFVYVSGHSHRNYFYDENKTRIYSDNQIGYDGNNFYFKCLSIAYDYDWFSYYSDGVYEISRKDYDLFNKGLNITSSFNTEYKKLYMLKKDGNYMFIVESNKGQLNLLNGGLKKRLTGHDIKYYYEKMSNYSKSLKMVLSQYSEAQNKISNAIKNIGGVGTIHGCIIDIDFYSHIYLNPYDGKVTCYYATDMTNKIVYKNLISILKYKTPSIFKNLSNDNKNELKLLDNDLTLSNKTIHYTKTDIYNISCLFNKLQYLTKYNLIRFWNDELADRVSLNSGKEIFQNLLEIEYKN